MEEIWIIMSVVLLSSVKLAVGGVPLAITLNFSFLQTIVLTSTGAVSGMLLFINLSDWIIHKYHMLFPGKGSKKKVFSRKNRSIVHVKNRYGLMGLAFLTPLFLSIPLGSFLAVRYFHNKRKIIVYMVGSILLWSVSLSTISFLF